VASKNHTVAACFSSRRPIYTTWRDVTPDAAATAVVDNLDSALASYSLAASEWNAGIVSSYGSVDKSKLQTYWATAGYLVESAGEKLESYESD
ncbi:MAG: hypothetical protein Q8S43_08725, partial [Actinomycetota bacterium]|nr:hypothetical protein [Actinomycetota bacterium]